METGEYQKILAALAARHRHLCPRQVLGIRIALAGAARLGLEVPRCDHRLIVILETDGCFADGIEAVTGVGIGQRTLRIEDYGKIAATFVDSKKEEALRVSPRPDVRRRAWQYARSETRAYFAQRRAYWVMPDHELLSIQPVRLHPSIQKMISRPGIREACSLCGEEIVNEREILRDGAVLCRACAGPAYYICGLTPPA